MVNRRQNLTNDVIRHVCAGHEYRYNIATGEVTNNYGTLVAVLRWEKFIPDGVAHICSVFRVGKHWPELYSSDYIAGARNIAPDDHPTLARFAIGLAATLGG